jgi:hypothetical protein
MAKISDISLSTAGRTQPSYWFKQLDGREWSPHQDYAGAPSAEKAVALARHLAGFFGPEFDSLPRDKVQLREWQRAGGAGQTDETQDGLIEVAISVIAFIEDREKVA